MRNMEENKPEKNTPMTHDERLKLAEKLDKDLDAFISSLPKKKYDDGWPEDRWEEEMAKHPFFMKEAPKPGDELHPLYEGLQKLKYDPEENEPQELAVAYKDDGNFNFKYKNYRLAIVAYTEGIKQKCGDPDIEASLLNNRAASHFFLKNYRSCLRDCELALKIKPDYDKVLIRAANCCFQMKQYQKAVEYCDKILEKQKTNKEILELRKTCMSKAKLKDRDERKKELDIKKKEVEEEKLIQEILKRGYKIQGRQKGKISLNELEPCFPQLVSHKVHFDESTGCLLWPVILVYPEYKIMDYIQGFPESDSFSSQLNCMFETYPEWDEGKKYKVENLHIYFETDKKKIVKVDNKKTLGEALKTEGYIIRGGTPSFIILVKNSEAEKKFLDN